MARAGPGLARQLVPASRSVGCVVPARPTPRAGAPRACFHAAPRRGLATEAPSAKPCRFLILGAPGAGKGTLSQRVLDTANGRLHNIVMGDILRAEIRSGSELGRRAKDVIASGALLPDESLIELMRKALEPLRGQNIIFDGYPRRPSQATQLDTLLEELDGAPVNLVIDLAVPDEVILERIAERWIHAPSGRTYNTSFNPPKSSGKDDVTGEPLTQRPDDTAEVFGKRLDAFHQETAPLRKHYAEQDTPCYESFAGRTSNEIWPKIRAAVFESGRFPALTPTRE